MGYIEGISIWNDEEDTLEFDGFKIWVNSHGRKVEFTPTAYQLRRLADWCDETARDMED